MKKNRKSTLIISSVLAVLSIIVFASYFVMKDLNRYENGEKVRDENALMIGTYTKTINKIGGGEYYNRLYIDIYHNGSKVESLTYLTSDTEMITMKDLPNISFIDLKDVMKKYTDNLGIRYWHLSKPTSNYITVATEWTCAPYLSSKITISDTGLYAVNVPIKNGQVPQVQHSYIYLRNVFGW